MIELDIDLAYLTKHFQVGVTQLKQYGENISLKKILETEAANGNKDAEKFDLEVLKNPRELVKLFKLSNSKNRYKILRHMNEIDLGYLMQYLDKKDLVYALNFFSKEKLLDSIKNLDKKEILKIAFEAFSKEDYLTLIPEKEMEKFFKSQKVDKNQLKEAMSMFQPAVLAKFLEAATGEKVKDGLTTPELMKKVRELKPQQLQDGLESLNKVQKMYVILELTKKDEDLWQQFSTTALMKPLEKLEKTDLIKSMNALEEDSLLKVLDELPQDFMAIVVTQIDPQVFADQLCRNYKDILEKIVAV